MRSGVFFAISRHVRSRGIGQARDVRQLRGVVANHDIMVPASGALIPSAECTAQTPQPRASHAAVALILAIHAAYREHSRMRPPSTPSR